MTAFYVTRLSSTRAPGRCCEAQSLQLAGQLIGQLRRSEAGLYDQATLAAIEEPMALGIGRFDPGR